MLSVPWNAASRPALPLFLGRLRMLSLPRKNPSLHSGIRHLPNRISGKPARRSIWFGCSYRVDLCISLARLYAPVRAFRHERRFLLWRLYLCLPGAAGIGSAPHPRGGVQPLFYLLAPSDIGPSIPELSFSRGSLLTLENGKSSHVPAHCGIARCSALGNVSATSGCTSYFVGGLAAVRARSLFLAQDGVRRCQ